MEKRDEESLLPKESTGSGSYTGVYLGFSLVVLLLSIFSMIYVIISNSNVAGDRKETVVDKIIKQIVYGSLNYVLPTRFGVHKNYIIPPSNQMNRGTCWAFSAVMLLESQYRYQGIEKGFLKPNEYVNFSKQAYGAWIGQMCEKTNSSSKACKHGGFAAHTTEDQKADSLFYFAKDYPELLKSILPEAVCPYFENSSTETDYKCPGMEEALKTNPIQFTIKGIKAASDVQSTKKLLVEAQRTLVIGTPLAELEFLIPCDNPVWNESEECLPNMTVKCPDSYEYEECARLLLPGRAKDGTFLLVDDYNKSVKWGGHAMNVVGYNDDWVYRNRHVFDNSLANLRGGFILHNSWRNQGHSFEYLMGRRSDENEAVICPNHNTSMNWVPATLDCIQQEKGDVTKCGNKYNYVRGKGLTGHSDKLICLDKKYCDVDRYYVLSTDEESGEDVKMDHLFTGLDKIRFISFAKDGTDIKYEYIEKLPFHYLHQAFRPVDEFLVDNDIHQCGYFMMPYQVIGMMNRKNWALLDNYHTADIEVEFADSSYLRSPDSKKYNTSLLEQSTWVLEETEFEGPLPYKYIY